MNHLQKIKLFLKNNRRSGTSTLLNKIASENDCYVLVANDMEINHTYRDIKEKCISILNLFDLSKDEKKPILIDPKVLRDIIEIIDQEENKKFIKGKLVWANENKNKVAFVPDEN
jgi:hypothetical protein